MLGFSFSPGFAGLQKSKVAFHVFLGIVCVELQGLIGVLFTPHQLLDADLTKPLEGKGVVGHVAIVGIGVQQPYDQLIGNSALEEISYGVFVVRRHFLGSHADAPMLASIVPVHQGW